MPTPAISQRALQYLLSFLKKKLNQNHRTALHSWNQRVESILTFKITSFQKHVNLNIACDYLERWTPLWGRHQLSYAVHGASQPGISPEGEFAWSRGFRALQGLGCSNEQQIDFLQLWWLWAPGALFGVTPGLTRSFKQNFDLQFYVR